MPDYGPYTNFSNAPFSFTAAHAPQNEKSNIFFLVLMTHGGDQDTIQGTDSTMRMSQLLEIFSPEKLPECLHGKPLVFIVQVSWVISTRKFP